MAYQTVGAAHSSVAALGHRRRTSPTDLTADPCAGPEQQAIDADTAHTLRTLLTGLTPRQHRTNPHTGLAQLRYNSKNTSFPDKYGTKLRPAG